MNKNYFYLLDLLRFLAALAVLFWHYQHFLSPKSASPLYTIFWPFYEYGDLAVHLFWIISGFVFANVYINNRSTTKIFFINRLARLYPLHFVTLVVVAILQAVNLRHFGEFKIYEFNDLYHFILNLLFISEWGFQMGRSFNAPIWSVSIEIFIYAVFVLVLPLLILFRYFFLSLVFALMTSLVFLDLPGKVFWLCGSFFFVGTLLYFLFEDGFTKKNILYILILISLIILMLPDRIVIEIILFSAVVLFVAQGDRLVGKYLFAWPKFGDLSYGIYLWHIPVQLTLILVMSILSLDGGVVKTFSFFLVYLFSVIIISYLGFKFIEEPVGKHIKILCQ